MNRTYEDMSKQELITLVKRLAKQHDEWREQVEYFKGLVDHYKDELLKAMEMSDEAKRLREENEMLRKADWEYECLWTWLAENTNLLNTIEPLVEEWKKEMIE